VIAVVLAIAFIVWLIVRDGGSSKPAQSGTVPTTTTPAVAPKAVSEADLRALAVQTGHPIYWVGPEPDHVYELTRTSSGRIFVRYLPKGEKVGTKKLYTIVGTYPVGGAFSRLKAQAKSGGDVTFSVPGGGFAAYAPSQPTNIYVAFPNSSVQIELYDPSAKRARSLVASGQIAPAR
jgi:hypothetical protein